MRLRGGIPEGHHLVIIRKWNKKVLSIWKMEGARTHPTRPSFKKNLLCRYHFHRLDLYIKARRNKILSHLKIKHFNYPFLTIHPYFKRILLSWNSHWCNLRFAWVHKFSIGFSQLWWKMLRTITSLLTGINLIIIFFSSGNPQYFKETELEYILESLS